MHHTLAHHSYFTTLLSSQTSLHTSNSRFLIACHSFFNCGPACIRRAGVRVGRAPVPQAGARVTVTMQDGKRVVYHTGRRDALQRALLGAALLGNDSFRWLWHPSLAYAGLLQFPTTRLNNTYYLVCWPLLLSR